MSETIFATCEDQSIHVSNDDVFHLLAGVASLISQRADRRAAVANKTGRLSIADQVFTQLN